MTPPLEDLHVYLRSITPDERTSLSVLAQLVPQGGRVLDLGCGSGALGQYLLETKGCSVDGVTLSEAEAAHARPHYHRVVVDNLESCDLLATFSGQCYDAIVCADVLEHLSRPERVLAACRELLTPQGQLLFSVPNAGYCGLVVDLLHGEFRYREEGLLDRTHLRFYTRRSLTRLMHEQHWSVGALDTIQRELPESEFQVEFDSLPPAVARYMLAVPDALTYQFVGFARPIEPDAAAATPPSAIASQTQPAHAIFTSQLYLGDAGQYAETNKIIATGIIGTPRQTLQFVLPRFQGTTPRLRLDPADRPGFLHLHTIRLRNSEGSLCWQWKATAHSEVLLGAEAHQQIFWHAPLPTAPDSLLLLLTGDDPWFELPIDIDTLANCLRSAGAVLEIELGWPMSADYLSLSSTVKSLEEHIAHMERTLTKIQTERTQATMALTATSTQLTAANAQITQLSPAQQEYVQLQARHQQLQAKHQQLQSHLQSIENSTIFKVTRPIVWAKMRVDQLWGRSPSPAPEPELELEPELEPALPTAAPELVVPPSPPPAVQETAPCPPAISTPVDAIDIIVPVFRSLADTRLCVESVLASPIQTPYRLIVINDASPEPELGAWLQHKAAQDSRVVLLENDSNLGFVGSVNRGMAFSDDRDVLLLNSDTEVANDWLDRLHHAAYSGTNIGTVTPFSNNATICSYPHFCSSNDLPAGYDTAQLDTLCAQTNPGAVIDIPTGVGFCMYIRRDCLAQVGLFDVENFGKGYGEENDFCQRAAQMGWRNLHALDTFVRHTGGVSFGDSKSPREQAALKTLQRLHPHYTQEVQAFVAADPARPYRNALDFARLRAHALPRVLTVLHNAGGGTLRHVQELAAYLHNQIVTLSLVPLPEHFVRLQWFDPHEALQQIYHWPTQAEELLSVLRSLEICHVHYHHLLGVDPEIMQIPVKLGITYDFTAHDYYTACPQIALVDTNQAYCGEQGIDQCRACVAQRPAPTLETIEDWRLRHRLFLGNARYLLTPSRDAAHRLMRYFPNTNIRFAPHSDIAANAVLPQPQPRRLSAQAHLRILVLGAVNQMKGADILEATALQAARTSAPLEFHLVGYPHRTLKTQPHASLTVHGPYADSDLPRLLERLQPDVVWFPALWPETYSYTLSACLLAGVPIIAPDLGAFPERLSQRRWSWIKPWNTTASAWLEIFEQLRSRYFLTGQEPPPAPEFTASDADDSLVPWSYATDYLRDLTTPPPP